MSDNTNPTENTCNATSACSVPKSPVMELKGLIDTGIANSGPTVKESVVKLNIDLEINRRVDLMNKLYAAILAAKKEINKFKPDNVSYTLDGKIAMETYSKAVLDNRKKAVEKLTKAENVLGKMLTENDFSQTESVLNELKATAGKPDTTEAKSDNK